MDMGEGEYLRVLVLMSSQRNDFQSEETGEREDQVKTTL